MNAPGSATATDTLAKKTASGYLSDLSYVPGLTSIIILTFNGWQQTQLCLESLVRFTPEPHELILVDNGSTDGTVERLREFVASHTNARLIVNSANLGFAAGNNQGLAIARGEYVLLLNNDTAATDGWLSRMISVLNRHPDVGLVGPMSNYVSGPQVVPNVPYRDFQQLQDFAGRWSREHDSQTMPTTRLVGFCLLAKRKVVDAIGGLDPRFGTGNFEDDDFCVRALFAGFKLVIAVDAFVHHTGGQTFKSAGIDLTQSMERNWRIFKEKWGIPAETPLGGAAQFQINLDERWRYDVPLPAVDESMLFRPERPRDPPRPAPEPLREQPIPPPPPDRAPAAEVVPSSAPAIASIAPARPPAHPKLSVLIPAYNRPEMLAECLQSLRSVTVECEIVVVDDASPTDLTEAVAQRSREDPRIRFLRNETNLGPTRNFNRAVAEARGDYLCILGDDDTSLPGNFERKTGILDRHPEIGFVYSRYNYTDKSNQPMAAAAWPGLVDYSYIGGRDEFMDLLPWDYLSLHSVVYRRSLFEEHGGFDEGIAEFGRAWDLNLRLARHAQTAYLNEPLLNVRLHENTATSVARTNGQLAAGKIAVWRKWLVKREPPMCLDERIWRHMTELFEQDLKEWLQEDHEAIFGWLAELERLRRDNALALARQFSKLTGKLAPKAAVEPGRPASPASVGHSGGDRSGHSTHLCHPAPAITWTGPVWDGTPSGHSSRAFSRALLGSGYQLRLEPASWTHYQVHPSAADQAVLSRAVWKRPEQAQPYIHVWNTLPSFVESDPAAISSVGRIMLGEGPLPDDAVERLTQLDWLWVPTEVALESLAGRISAERVRVLPEMLDTRLFEDRLTPVRPMDRKFCFLSVVDWSLAQGWDVLFRAYLREFREDEDVGLLLLGYPSGPFLNRLVHTQVNEVLRSEGMSRRAPTFMVSLDWEEFQLPSIYRGASAYVQPSRETTWNRRLMEAMAGGLPVIAMPSAHNRTFLNASNSYLIEAKPTTANEPDPDSWHEGQVWLEPSIDHLRDLMRQVFSSGNEARQKAKQAQITVRDRFRVERVMPRLIQLIEEASSPRTKSSASGRQASSTLVRTHAKTSGTENRNGSAAPGADVAAIRQPVDLPDLSILIPAYNQPEMLDECLESMHSIGKHIKYEIVVVDDASPRDLRSIVSRHAERNSSIRYLRNETRLGIPKNFNHTLAQARGKYICMLGQDDAVLPDNFDRKLAVLDEHPTVGLIYSRWYVINGGDPARRNRHWLGHPSTSYVGGRPEFRDLFMLNYINLAACVFRRELYQQLGGFDERIRALCDWDLFLRFCRHTETAFLDESLVSVKTHRASDTTQLGYARLLQDRLLLWRKWLVESSAPPRIDHNMWQHMLDSFRMDITTTCGEQSAETQRWFKEIDQLQHDYRERMERLFQEASSATSSGITSDAGSIGAGTSPLPAEQALAAFERGRQLIEAGNWAEAAKAFEQAIASNPSMWSARYLQGCAQLQLGRSEEAVETFQAVAVAMPEISDVHNALGSALKELGRETEAVYSFNRALELKPDNLDAWINLAELYLSAGNTAAAQQSLTRAIRIAPDDAHVLQLQAALGTPVPN